MRLLAASVLAAIAAGADAAVPAADDPVRRAALIECVADESERHPSDLSRGNPFLVCECAVNLVGGQGAEPAGAALEAAKDECRARPELGPATSSVQETILTRAPEGRRGSSSLYYLRLFLVAALVLAVAVGVFAVVARRKSAVSDDERNDDPI